MCGSVVEPLPSVECAGPKEFENIVAPARPRRHPPANAGKVLVLGDDTRSFLAIVRSLGRAGLEVHAAPPTFVTSPALTSRYIFRLEHLPPYLGDGEEWFHSTSNLLRREAFDLVIPCDERTILPFHANRQRFEPLSSVAIPGPASFDTLFDKGETRRLAHSLGVSVPPGRLLAADDTAEGLAQEFGLPLVLKPCRSYRLETLHHRGRAAICDTIERLSKALSQTKAEPYLVEGLFPGQGAGMSILASSGKILQAFQHLRAREADGAGYYRVSVPLRPDLLEAVTRIAAALGFTGIAMFEFKIDPATGSWVLLEVNARPWGSMPLPVSLGIDFPLRWYRLLAEGQETAPVAYRTGVYGRNLLSDARQILHYAREAPGAASGLSYLGTSILQFGRLAIGREHLDTLVRDDPRPGLAEIRQVAASQFKQRVSPLRVSSRLRRRRDRALIRKLLSRINGTPLVLTVICQGNICRSPFAAALLRRALEAEHMRADIRTAGILPRAGAPSPDTAIATARRFGIDLSPHRSTHLSRETARESTVAIVFDRRNLEDVEERYPELKGKTVLLGSFAPDPAITEIPDPDGRPQDVFVRTYEVISRAVPALAASIIEVRGETQPQGAAAGNR